MKILISGGHLTPALAMIDYLQLTGNDEIVYVGRLYSQPQHRQRSPEKEMIEKRGIKFIPFKSFKLNAHQRWYQQLSSLGKFFKSLQQSKQIFSQEKPTVMLSFGGYLALPLALIAKLTGVPIVTHEQTRAAGLANQVIAKLARFVAISSPESRSYFPYHKTKLTGNPIRPAILQSKPAKPKWLTASLTPPVLLVMGGNQGSAIINRTIQQALPELVKTWTVVHLCGHSTPSLNYLKMLNQAKRELPEKLQSKYVIKEWINGQDLAYFLSIAQAAISRAGANSVTELTLKKVPTIFIPLMTSHHDEQRLNVKPLVTTSAALLIEQNQLNTQTLLTKLDQLASNILSFKQALQLHQPPTDGAHQLYLLLQHATAS